MVHDCAHRRYKKWLHRRPPPHAQREISEIYLTRSSGNGSGQGTRPRPQLPFNDVPRPHLQSSNIPSWWPRSGILRQDNRQPSSVCSCQYSSHARWKASSRIRCQSIYCQWWLRGPVSPCSTGLGLATALAVSVIGTQVKPRPKPRTSVQPHCLLICFTAIWALASNTTSLNVEMWRAVSTAAQDGRTRRVQIYAPPP
jgi:hypothetical protein